MNYTYGLYTTIDDSDLTRAASERYALLQIATDRKASKTSSVGAPSSLHQLAGLLRIRLRRRDRAWTDAA